MARGGLSLGLQQAGFTILVGADIDAVSMETHTANVGGLGYVGDLSEPDDFLARLKEWGIRSVDLVAGGPPCQPFEHLSDTDRLAFKDALNTFVRVYGFLSQIVPFSSTELERMVTATGISSIFGPLRPSVLSGAILARCSRQLGEPCQSLFEVAAAG